MERAYQREIEIGKDYVGNSVFLRKRSFGVEWVLFNTKGTELSFSKEELLLIAKEIDRLIKLN